MIVTNSCYVLLKRPNFQTLCVINVSVNTSYIFNLHKKILYIFKIIYNLTHTNETPQKVSSIESVLISRSVEGGDTCAAEMLIASNLLRQPQSVRGEGGEIVEGEGGGAIAYSHFSTHPRITFHPHGVFSLCWNAYYV